MYPICLVFLFIPLNFYVRYRQLCKCFGCHLSHAKVTTIINYFQFKITVKKIMLLYIVMGFATNCLGSFSVVRLWPMPIIKMNKQNRGLLQLSKNKNVKFTALKC